MIATEPMIRAAAEDAGFRNMRAHDRTSWNEDDYNVASTTYTTLLAQLYPDPWAGNDQQSEG